MHRIAVAAGEDIEVLQTSYGAEEMLDERTDEMEDEYGSVSGEDAAEDTAEDSDDYLDGKASQQEEEDELRRTVQAVFELEEALLNQHMSNIQVEYFDD